VRQDVIELTQRRRDVEDVHRPQLDVVQSELAEGVAAVFDLHGREIDAEERGARELHCHRHEIPAAGAAELQHAAGGDRRCVQSAADLRDSGEAAGMREGKSAAGVGNFVVAALNRINAGNVRGVRGARGARGPLAFQPGHTHAIAF
jgi:hypothetical protein